MKVCANKTCQIPITDRVFGPNKKTKDGLQSRCRVCMREYVSAWQKANPEKVAARSRKYFYGISGVEYNHLFAEQNGCCAVCKRHQSELKFRLAVDHCHESGKIRGLLCQQCNQASGLLGENPETIKALLVYVSAATELKIVKDNQ